MSWPTRVGASLSSLLTGLSTASSAVVTASDSLLSAIGKLQGQFNALSTDGFQGSGTYSAMLAIASPVEGMTFRVTDIGNRSTIWEYRKGAQVGDTAAALGWYPFGGRQTIFAARLKTFAAPGGVTPTLLYSVATLPAGFMDGVRNIRTSIRATKSSNADTVKIHHKLGLGSGGSPASGDITICTPQMNTGAKNLGTEQLIARVSATSVRRTGNNDENAASPMHGSNASGAAAVTLASSANLDSDALYFSLWMVWVTGTSETLTIDGLDVYIEG